MAKPIARVSIVVLFIFGVLWYEGTDPTVNREIQEQHIATGVAK